ncbi:MAG TPA: NAD(P)H-hydrate dehydratase [Patescibacteria group bacterium]
MQVFDTNILKKLYIPSSSSHKGDNGKVMIIGGSKLFHAASLWPLEIASKIVDMVFYSSVDENNEIVLAEKQLWRNGIVVPRGRIDDYITEADAVLIGPGLPRENGLEKGDDDTKELTEALLTKYPNKRWVIDGGSLQTISPELLPKNSILTPHHREFEILKSNIKDEKLKSEIQNKKIEDQVSLFAKEYDCTVLLKGEEDIVCSNNECLKIVGGNAGMTKGGTGDVLAGLTTALYAQNDDPFLVASCSSYINKKAGESLSKTVGIYFNATDLVEEIPVMMNKLLNNS